MRIVRLGRAVAEVDGGPEALESIKAEDTRRESFDDVTALAYRVLEETSRRGIPPDPRVFELFYVYLEGTDAELSEAVDMLLPDGEGASLNAVDRLYEEHLALGDKAGRYMEISARAEKELGTLSASLARKSVDDDRFRDTLAKARDGMSILMRPSTARQVIRDMLEVTETYATQNEFFAGELSAAHAQIGMLHDELRELRESAFADHLTGLANRRRFDLVLELEIDARATKGPFSLVMTDVDRFKRVNDQFGHAVGDSVLKQYARLIRQNVQGKDTAARYGGEEFALILPSTEILGARHVAERIRQGLAARNFVVSDTKERLGAVTASFGVAEHREGETAAELIARCDKALYKAKETGRNRVTTAS